jgi:hypothetical protein
MGVIWARLQLGMELAGHQEGVILRLDDLHVSSAMSVGDAGD